MTCAPGKGDVGGLSFSRELSPDGKLESWIFARSSNLVMRFEPLREVKVEPVLPAPEPGATLTNGEGPLPDRTFQPGRPAWFDGELKTGLALHHRPSDTRDKARDRLRESLLRETMVVSANRVSYAGHVCSAPRFEQRLVKQGEWANGGGVTIKGTELWVVHVACPRGKGDLDLEFGRSIVRGKPNDNVEASFEGFSVYWNLPKPAK